MGMKITSVHRLQLTPATLNSHSRLSATIFEVACVSSTTSCSIQEMKIIFAGYGIPNTLVTDNAPPFSSGKFPKFAKTWSFEHTTSLPRYPKTNEKAENAVHTVKCLFTKCKASGVLEYLMLLDWQQYSDRRHWYQPWQVSHGEALQDPIASRRHAVVATVLHGIGCHALEGMKQHQQHYYKKV